MQVSVSAMEFVPHVQMVLLQLKEMEPVKVVHHHVKHVAVQQDNVKHVLQEMVSRMELVQLAQMEHFL